MNLLTLQRRLVLVAVALTPIFNVGELAEALRGSPISQVTAVTPIYIKLIKDLTFAMIIVAGMVVVWRSRRMYSNTLLYLLLFVCLSGLVGSLATMPDLLLLAGLRSLLPLIAIVFLWRAVDTALQKQIAIVLASLQILAFVMQLYQLFYFPHFWGTNPFGLNARNPGFFLIPSTMGSFACFTLYYAFCYLPKSPVRSLLIFFVCPVSVVLTLSAAALLSMVAAYAAFLYFSVRERYVVVFGFVVVAAVGAALLPELLAREEVYRSLEDRVGILLSNIDISHVIASPTFGMATNVGINLLNTFDIEGIEYGGNAIIADSTLISFMLNFGMLASFLYVLALLFLFSYRVEYAVFMAVISVFSITVIVVESFPISLLLSVNFVYLHYLRSAGRIPATDPGGPATSPAPMLVTAPR